MTNDKKIFVSSSNEIQKRYIKDLIRLRFKPQIKLKISYAVNILLCCVILTTSLAQPKQHTQPKVASSSIAPVSRTTRKQEDTVKPNTVEGNIIHIQYLNEAVETDTNPSKTLSHETLNAEDLNLESDEEEAIGGSLESMNLTNDSLEHNGTTPINFGAYQVFLSGNWVETGIPGILKDKNDYLLLGTSDMASQFARTYYNLIKDNLYVPDGFEVLLDGFGEDISNYSLENVDTYIWQKEINLGNIKAYESVLTLNGHSMALFSMEKFRTVDLEYVYDQIVSKLAPKQYKIGTDVTNRFETFNNMKFIVPSQATPMESLGLYNVIDLGKNMSNNKLYVTTVSNDNLESELLSRVNLLFNAEDIDSQSITTNTLDTTATWLYRTAQYREYTKDKHKVALYIFPNHIKGNSSVFAVVEKDNKFPEMLKYLNTLAREIR